MGYSFETIAGFGPNGAIIHYRYLMLGIYLTHYAYIMNSLWQKIAFKSQNHFIGVYSQTSAHKQINKRRSIEQFRTGAKLERFVWDGIKL